MAKKEKVKKPFYKKVWFWILAVIVVFAIGGNMGGEDTNQTEPKAEKEVAANATETKAEPAKPAKKEAPKNKEGINKEEFAKIQNGMTYEEVVKIIGNEGELQSTAGDGQYKTEMYTWQGESGFGSNANVTLQGNKVQAKAQFGLE